MTSEFDRPIIRRKLAAALAVASSDYFHRVAEDTVLVDGDLDLDILWDEIKETLL